MCASAQSHPTPTQLRPPPLPGTQAWDNVIGQNAPFVRNTALGAMGAAGVVGVAAMFVETKRQH